MATATMACMTWDSDTSSWKSDACDVSVSFVFSLFYFIWDNQEGTWRRNGDIMTSMRRQIERHFDVGNMHDKLS